MIKIILSVQKHFSICIAFSSEETAEILKNKIVNEKNGIARSYAILSWIDVVLAMSNDVKTENIYFLQNQMKIENDNYCVLSFYYGLYLFGVKEYFNKICSFLDSPEYQLRCAAISRLRDIKNDINKIDINAILIKLLETEDTLAVKDNAEKLLKELHFS